MSLAVARMRRCTEEAEEPMESDENQAVVGKVKLIFNLDLI